MKANRRTLLLVVLLTVALLALLWLGWRRRDEKRRNVVTSDLVSGDKNSAPGTAVVDTPKPSPRATMEAPKRSFITAFNTPIAFYGRVMDQYGDPVPDADVKFSANDKASGGRPSEYAGKTDTGGRFSIEGIVGITLGVEVSKLGYYSIPPAYGKATSSGVFEYGISPQDRYHP